MSTYRRKLKGTGWTHRPLVTREELDEYFREDWPNGQSEAEPEAEPEPQENN
jgi:hypothetical protein